MTWDDLSPEEQEAVSNRNRARLGLPPKPPADVELEVDAEDEAYWRSLLREADERGGIDDG